MHAMASKYSRDFPMHRPSRSSDRLSSGCIVLLTGSTGGLGSTTLSTLLESPEVSCVYALNRKGVTSLEHRQRKAFEERAIDLSLLSSPKIVLLEGDLDQDWFGLSPLKLEKVRFPVSFRQAFSIAPQIKNRITHIIHNGAQKFNIYPAVISRNTSKM